MVAGVELKLTFSFFLQFIYFWAGLSLEGHFGCGSAKPVRREELFEKGAPRLGWPDCCDSS